MKHQSIIDKIGGSQQVEAIVTSGNSSLQLSGVVGSAAAIIVGSVAERKKGLHIIIAESKDDAGYFYNDLTSFWNSQNIYFFPSSFKRSIVYGQEKPSGIVQRSALFSRLKEGIANDEFIAVCTYPEAIIEKSVTAKEIKSNSVDIKVGESYSISFIDELLRSLEFQKSDFVYEPGQFSVRGGIVDIFSYSDNRPYRLDFFGDELESIRVFDINSQESIEKRSEVTIFPKFGSDITVVQEWMWIDELLADFGVKNVTYWVKSGVVLEQKAKDIRRKLFENYSPLIEATADYSQMLQPLREGGVITIREGFRGVRSDKEIKFNTSPQISFNKNFELLYSYFSENLENGYDNYIVTQNQNQIERLENIFISLDKKKRIFKNIPVSIHEGFVDNDARVALLTDHQIFERHHRYEVASELPKAESLTISELTSLSIGDYVVHVDHGVARFGGLVQSSEGGKVVETVKLTYANGDFLLVNVHSLHKISKYRDKDTTVTTKVHTLGHGAWQKLKTTTKAKVKDIVKDLIQLYAKRRSAEGFAFSPDSYLQHELEASFIYEDTPDQQKATEAFKVDMERKIPMDRLVCGDVGFGKTEIAIRAAFKAACDGKQVAVLVPTTILSLQHYRSFSQRLKEFPVTVELLSRAKTAKQVTEILHRLEKGEIDILIGTHKILGKAVKFKDLGLLIVDEEQKFGVSSKEKLRQIRANIDTLTLTATPIPRTLQFSLMGARELSIINTPPPNRQPVSTEVHSFNKELLREAISYEIGRGGQAYFVHNNVSTIHHMASIITDLVPDARVVVGHGQMDPKALEKIITDFIYGEYDVLVSTTIVESGIDISNANTMIINNAQNFGLSDLHQLRGRVGRSNKKAYCYLFIPSENTISEIGRRRLRAIEDFSDLGAGFNIAMQDLDIRGAGNLLGGEQSGFIADIGFETYQKILNEAIVEFRDEYKDILDDEQSQMVSSDVDYVTDCQMDIGYEALIPDSYVSNLTEKIKLYRKIDNIADSSESEQLKKSIIDRFGKLPEEVVNLFDVVEIRRLAQYLGFEKVIVKNGYLITHFISNGASSYYDSVRFKSLTKYIMSKGDKFKLKQKPKSLLLSIAGVDSLKSAKNLLENMKGGSKGKF
ncbi:MAG: transcription-repair coupling factor [Rikenellaceae bacterium]